MNSTITNTQIVIDFWHIGIADYIAWGIGIIAIIIAVFIFRKQERVFNKIDVLRRSNIQLSLTIIYDFLTQTRLLVNQFHGNVQNDIERYKKDTDVLRNMLKNTSPTFLMNAKTILNENEYLRINPTPISADLYSDIKECGERIRVFIDGDNGLVFRGLPETVDSWLRYGGTLLEKMDNTIKEIAKELAS